MNNINSILASSLDKYFTLLSKTGYYRDIDSLIVLLGIRDLFEYFWMYISEEDLRSIINALYRLSGNCLIDIPVKYTLDSLFHELKSTMKFKLNEQDTLKITEDQLLISVN